MTKTLYLHIGTHKTGTTTIQHFLYSNDELLGKYRIAYPKIPYIYPRKNKTRNGCFISWPVKDENGKRDKAQEEQRFTDGMNLIYDLFNTRDTVILSDEALYMRLYENSGLLEKVMEDSELNNYTLKLIIYLRRQDQYIESLWNQSIKEKHNTPNTTVEDYLSIKKQNLEYYKLLDYYASVVGDENIVVRRYADSADFDALQDFLQVIGIDSEDAAKNVPLVNTGLYGNTVRIKQLINQVKSLSYIEQKFFRDSLLLCSEVSKQNYPCSEFSEEERREFMSHYEEKNHLVAERFIDDGKPLFNDDYSGLPKRENMNPELLNDIVRSAAATDLLLYRQNQNLSERVKTLEDKLSLYERRMNHIRHPFKAVVSWIKKLIK